MAHELRGLYGSSMLGGQLSHALQVQHLTEREHEVFCFFPSIIPVKVQSGRRPKYAVVM